MFLKIIKGMFESNCYITAATEAREAAVIDCGADHKEIGQVLKENNLLLKYIILTHAHIDHIAQAFELQNACGGGVVIHIDDAPLLGDPLLNGSAFFDCSRVFKEADLCVKDGDILKLGGLSLDFIHTPGHTPGSMCVLAGSCSIGDDKCLFTGDTLFRLGVGRTDLGAGDADSLQSSLNRLMEFDDTLRVYPGHGPETSIGYERKYNRFLRA